VTAGAEGTSVTHRRYVSQADCHYGGGLVDGAFLLRLFGEAATELSVRLDHDEGLLAGYDDVRLLEPVRAGDVVEVTATATRIGRRSRTVRFEASISCRAAPDRSASAADPLEPPLVAATATGTVVVPESALTDR
jgi:3-aminobutyryl-CoA ammonia-lyase